MPTLKNLKCSIEIPPDHIPLSEYGTTFQDGFVQTFVAVPSKPSGFSIHLTSDSYIAPGLGMFVFVDSIFQCNRVRRDLKVTARGSRSHETEIDFRVRQKEERISKGTYIARDWNFASLIKGKQDSGSTSSTRFTRNVGCIEVVVLRCHAEPGTSASSRHQEQAETQAPPATKAPAAVAVLPKSSIPDHQSKATTSKPPRAAPPRIKAASVKSSTSSPGLMGLFDGAGDEAEADKSEILDKERPHVKKYWSEWKPKRLDRSDKQQAYVIADDTVQLVAEEEAGDRSHQLHTGRGAIYSHKTTSPKYMDTMERPYAVFWFGYRKKETIEKMLNIKISDPAPDEQAALMKMSKQDLIKELIKAREKPTPEKKPMSTVGEKKEQPAAPKLPDPPAVAINEASRKEHKKHEVKHIANKTDVSKARPATEPIQTKEASVTKVEPAKAEPPAKVEGSNKAASFINLGTTKGNLDWSKEPEGTWGAPAAAAGAAATAVGWGDEPAAAGDWNTAPATAGWDVGAPDANMGKQDTAAGWGAEPDPQEYSGL